MDYVLHISIVIAIYAALAVSLNLVAGYTGLLSLAHAAFYGLGAYVAALMALHTHAPFWLVVICVVGLSALVSLLVALPSLRMRDDYFVITTFALQVIAFSILNNWGSVTGGPMGLPGIPQPVILGWRVSSEPAFLMLAIICLAGVLLITRGIVLSPVGRVLKAIREDEVFTEAAGKNVARYKVLVFMIAGSMAAVAGVIYAYYISFIDPSSFTVMESVFIISIVIIGGAGSFWGPVVGAILLVALPESLRFVGMPDAIAANLRQILYGVLLVAFIMRRPQGVIGAFGSGDASAGKESEWTTMKRS